MWFGFFPGFVCLLLLIVRLSASVSATNHVLSAAAPPAACPAGDWLTPSARLYREQQLQRYVEQAALEVCSPPVQTHQHNCMDDRRRLYGYEHPAWPKEHGQSSNKIMHQHPSTQPGHVWYPQIYVVDTPRPVEFHALWKAGTTSLHRAFARAHLVKVGDRRGAHHQSNHKDYKRVLMTREPLARFASGVGEIYHRAVHQGNVHAAQVRWWSYLFDQHHPRHTHRLPDLRRLLEGMLLDLEAPRFCMGNAHPMHHLRSASMFYAAPRYPPSWTRPPHDWQPTFERLVYVHNRAPPFVPNNLTDDTPQAISLEQAIQDYGGDAHVLEQPSMIRNSTLKPSDVPHPAAVLAFLHRPDTQDLLQRVCRIYAADFICFGWDPPAACKTILFPVS